MHLANLLKSFLCMFVLWDLCTPVTFPLSDVAAPFSIDPTKCCCTHTQCTGSSIQLNMVFHQRNSIMKSQYMNTFRCAVVHDVPSLSIFSKMGLLLALGHAHAELEEHFKKKTTSKWHLASESGTVACHNKPKKGSWQVNIKKVVALATSLQLITKTTLA